MTLKSNIICLDYYSNNLLILMKGMDKNMALDGLVLNKLSNELNENLSGKKVNKIFLYNGDNIIFNIKDSNLLLSCNASYPRIYITKEEFTPDSKQSNFETNLRKYLTGSIITDIKQVGLDRIIEISFLALNDFKEKVTLKLIIEIMGKHSNIILTDEENIILDSYKHVTNFISSKRMIIPKGTYERVLDKDKVDVFDLFNLSSPDLDKTVNDILSKDDNTALGLNAFLTKTFYGISKTIALDIEDKLNSVYTNKDNVINSLNIIKEIIDNKNNDNYKIYFENDNPVDFHITNINKYDNLTFTSFKNVCEMIIKFYDKKARNNSIKNKSQDLKLLLNNIMSKDLKKKAIHTKNIEEAKDAENYKMLGDLIFANLYRISNGQSHITLENFYDDNKEIQINLDPNLSPSENANRFFKKYNKAKSTLKNSTIQLKEIDEEIVYLETVISYLDNALTLEDIDNIKIELEEGGYLKKKLLKNIKGKIKKEKKVESKPYKFISSDGYEILVGKNNIQNDEITLKVAKDSDVWLHVQDIPGSHVIIKTNGKGLANVPDNTLLEAAHLGVYFSKGRESTKVAIDYTERRYVKKPSGAKPGFVIFLNNKTLFITPSNEILNQFKIKI